MDIFSVLSYLNKISLLAFIVTAGFLGYQFYLLKKESSQTKQKTPIIPDFNENDKFDVHNFTKLNLNQEPTVQPVVTKKDNKAIPGIIIASSLLVLTVGVFLIIRNRQKEQALKLNQSINLISPTIKVSKLLTPTVINDNRLANIVIPTSTIFLTPTPIKVTRTLTSTPVPTEVILAKTTPTSTITNSVSQLESPTPTTLETLPLTGVIDKSLILFGIATSLIFFAFVF